MSAASPETTTACEPDAVVAMLEQYDLDALRLHWRNYLGSSAPAHLPRWLLMRILAYRLQVIVHGDLSAETKRLLGIASGRNRSRKYNRSEPPEASRDAKDVFGTGTISGTGSDGRHSARERRDNAEQTEQIELNDVVSGNRIGKVNAAVQFASSPHRQRRAFIKRAAVTRDGHELHPGSILAREWHDTMHRVMVGENGQFIFNGKAFGSLSQIAKLITGTNWNGHRFFGLKKGQS